MLKMLVLLFAVLSACATKNPQPAPASTSQVEIPKDALTLEQALSQGTAPTLEHLKKHLREHNIQVYESMNTKDPGSDLPETLRPSKPVADESKKELRIHLKKFRNMTWAAKEKKARVLLNEFRCEQVTEPQAMAFSLERNFPESEAVLLSTALHEKIIGCPEVAKTESVFRLTAFAIQQGHCEQALEHLKQFPTTHERGLNDRKAYLQNLCSQTAAVPGVETRNPWGGYGIRLGEVSFPQPEKPIWHLTTQSGSAEWDRLLASLVELAEKEQFAKIRHVAGLIDYEKFRALPASFQASVLMTLHFAGADLAVFQTLHRYLSDRPQMMTKDVASLLFPVRFWKEILAESSKTDPILVKALIRQESAFNPQAKSPAKAYGLMQLIYPTAKRFGMKSKKELFDPHANIRAGAKFLGELISEFGSVELALAAYNAGPQAVREWQKRYPTSNIDLFVEMIPYTETREYVRLVNRNYKIYQNLLLEKPGQAPGLAKQ